MKWPIQFATTLLLCIACLNGSRATAQSPPTQPSASQRRNEQRSDPLGELLRQAQEAIKKKEYGAAVPLLENYLAQRPEDATAHFQLGYAQSLLERWDAAKIEYSKAIALNPQLAAAHLNLGLVLLEREPSAALEPLRRAAELLPDQSRPQFLLALALERSGNLSEAIGQYQTAARLNGKNFEIRFALGRALLANGRAAEAESEFRHAIALRGDSAPAHLGLANSLLTENKREAAAAEFTAYLQVQPQDRESRLQLASILAGLERFDQALAELDRADAGTRASLESLKLRATIHLRRKQWAPAAEALQRALELAPRDTELRARLGRLLLEKREFSAAERELRQALQLDPNALDALRDLASAYYLGEKYQATLDTLDLLARHEAPRAGSWFVRATCYDKLGRKTEAVEAYAKFLSLDQGQSDKQGFQARQRIRLLRQELQRKKR